MARSGSDRGTREERERARIYQARKAVQTARAQRRTRDNLIGGIAGAVLILAIVGGQIAFFTAGPGAPAPSPTPTSTGVAPTPSETPAESPEPTPTTTP